MPPLFLSHHPQFSPLPEIVSLCEANSFGIELSAFSDIDIVADATQLDYYRYHLLNIQQRSIHGPYLDLYPGASDHTTRKLTLACFERVYQIAINLDIRHLLFHHNYDPSAGTPAQWLEYSCEFWQTYLTGKSTDIHIHLENVMDTNPQLIAAVVQRVARPNLDVALDIGHVHAYSNVSLSAWITQLGNLTGYVHLHDNHGREDDHLALGCGSINLIDTLNALSKHAPEAIWSIESGGRKMHHSIQWLRENGYTDRRVFP